jgi:arylsulfatase A-like enzyme
LKFPGHRLLRLDLLLLLPAFAAVAAPREAAPPNFVVILSDDHRPDALGVLNRQLRTPNLDRLVRAGVLFRGAHILGSDSGAVCVPSRAMFFSGRSFFRVGHDLAGAETWPEALRRAGYQTFATGKWHNGAAACGRVFPGARNIFLGGMTDQFRVTVQDFDAEGRPGPAREEARNATELFTDTALEMLRARDTNRPFALYVALTSPHDPRTAPPEYHARYDPAWMTLPENFLPEHPFDNGELAVRDEQLLPVPRTAEAVRQEIADYYAMITHLDAQVGRLLDALNAAGLAESTIVVFAGDNGLALGSHGLLGKQNLYQHSVGVPLIIAGAAFRGGRAEDALCYLHDVAPTLCELAGAAPPAGLEGRSLVRLLEGRTRRHRDELFFAYRGVQRAWRDERWKIIHYPVIGRTQLFDLREDPQETEDLAGEARQAGRLARLLAELEEARREAGDTLAP